MKKLSKYCIVMKIGPFCGYSLKEIISIKQNEEKVIGHFYLGYAGVFCHPKRVVEFIARAKSEKEKITVYFIATPSNFVSPIKRLKFYSKDSITWGNLSKEVLLVGSKFSIVGKGLRSANFDLDISQYQSVLGSVSGKRLHDYLKYRCDKSCAIYNPDEFIESKHVKIAYSCELTDCVYVK